jgi:high-affinity iron transporter
MSRHGRELAQQMDQVGKEVAAGKRPLYALAVVVGLAMLREGSEIVLFLWGIAAADSSPLINMVGGGVFGLAGGCLVGAALYLGLMRIPQRYIFTVTSWMIVLLAAGMASQAVGFLRQIDLLPALGEAVWDTSVLIQDQSLAGRALRTVVGYTARPDGIQVLAFLVTVAAIGVLTRWMGNAKAVRAPIVAAVFIAGFAYFSPSQAVAAADAVRVRVSAAETRGSAPQGHAAACSGSVGAPHAVAASS